MSAVDTLESDRERLIEHIRDAVQQVRRAARHYRRVSSALLLIGLLCGAVSTMLAGDAFRGGSVATRTAQATTGRVPAELAPGWRNLCGVIAVLTFAGTLATGTNSVLKLSEHQARTTACLTALAALQTELLDGSALQAAALTRAKAALDNIRIQYDEYFP
jgi:hypothetical protein